MFSRSSEGIERPLSASSAAASVGCAVYPEDGLEAGELLDAADAALLQRKREIASRPQRIL